MVDEVRMTLGPEDPDEPPLVAEPPRSPSAAEVLHRLESEAKSRWQLDHPGESLPAEPEEESRWPKFTLAQMFIALTAIALILGLLRLFAPSEFAVLTALALLGVTVYVLVRDEVNLVAWGVWALLLLTYLTASIVSLIKG
jgi:hypothetical protein